MAKGCYVGIGKDVDGGMNSIGKIARDGVWGAA